MRTRASFHATTRPTSTRAPRTPCGRPFRERASAGSFGERVLVNEVDPIALEADDLVLRVGQEDHVPDADVLKDLGADAVLAKLGDRLAHGVAVALADEAGEGGRR